jgi:hypothetical protein
LSFQPSRSAQDKRRPVSRKYNKFVIMSGEVVSYITTLTLALSLEMRERECS